MHLESPEGEHGGDDFADGGLARGVPPIHHTTLFGIAIRVRGFLSTAM
jgi:hypothetical protein